MPVIYPTPTQGGARYTLFHEPPRNYEKAVLEWIFKDGSASYRKQGSQGERLFLFRYGDLTSAEQLVHDVHFDSCFGTWLGFDFQNPVSGELLTNVHYKSYESDPRAINWRHTRIVWLVWRPLAGA